MEIDWNVVKKMTLWSYEDLMKKILKVLSYNFIQEHYNHSMKEAENYATRLLRYDPKYTEYISRLTDIFKNLDSLRVENYTELVRRVENREQCEDFLRKTKLPFKDFISVLNYVFRWVLPFSLYLRQLIDTSNEAHKEYIEELRNLGIRFNLDILEHGRTREGRERISEETGIPEAFILNLVIRADITRLPYMSRKTVNHLCDGGYDSVEKLAKADIGKLKEDMKSYFDKMGMRLSRSFIDLEGLIEWAKTVPKIVEI